MPSNFKHQENCIDDCLRTSQTPAAAAALGELRMLPEQQGGDHPQHRQEHRREHSEHHCRHKQSCSLAPSQQPPYPDCRTSSSAHPSQFRSSALEADSVTLPNSYKHNPGTNIVDNYLSSVNIYQTKNSSGQTLTSPPTSPPYKSCAQQLIRGRTNFKSAHLICLTVCLVLFVGYSESRPMNEADKRYRELHTNTVKYLAQFGYLRGPSRETQNLRSQEDLTRAIKALQKAGGIPQTGVVDHRTEALMLRPRCGNHDDFVDDARVVNEDDGFKVRKKRYTVATSKWPRTNITFSFVNYTPDMPQAKTRQLISDALRVWSDATPLSFTEVRDNNADIMIMFASQYHSDGYPFDGKGMVLGHAFFPGPNKGGDTHFDDDENWTTNSSDGVDLFMVAAHEFGHALGLAHSGDPSALMYPWYMGFEGQFQLPEDDKRGITSLYGTGEAIAYLPKTKVKMIPNSNIPVHRDPKPEVEPTKTTGSEVDKSGPADPCTSHFDAITVIRTEIFLFIGKWFWRLDSRKVITNPVEIHQFWYGLPKHLEKVDAVFERHDNKIVFFSGDRYWVFNANHLISGFPSEGRPITEFNIPADVKSINAAFVWGYNKRTYLVSGDMYWKMNEDNTFVEYDYPRDMGTWKGVPVPLDAAFKDLSEKTIFFQGLDFWEFYDMRMRVKNGYPKRISQHWLNCGGVAQRVEQKDDPAQASRIGQNSRAEYEDEEETDDSDTDGENSCLVNQFSGLVLAAVLLVYRFVSET